jgi:hypothetical protein
MTNLGKRASGVLCGVLLALLAMGCPRVLLAVSSSIEFTKEDLEEIRGVVIRYLEEKKPEDWEWENFLVELRRGAVFLEKEYPGTGPSIGLWRCEVDIEGIGLVRQPPINPETGLPGSLYFGVRLAKQDGKWTAISHFYRMEEWEKVP